MPIKNPKAYPKNWKANRRRTRDEKTGRCLSLGVKLSTGRVKNLLDDESHAR